MAENKREQIITTDTANRMIDRVSPIYEDAYVALWLYEAIGREYESFWDMIVAVPDQLFIDTVTWAIGLWERRYGVDPDESLSIERRRERVKDVRDRIGRYNNARLETWLNEKSGGATEVTDNVGTFTFGIQIESENGLLPTFDMDEAIAYINERKPSHLSYRMDFHSKLSSIIYVGLALYGSVTQQLGTIELPDLDADDYLADGYGDILMDGYGVALID